MYCTVDDIKKAIALGTLLELTQDDPNKTTINLPILREAIADASEKIDSALRGRYSLPLNEPVSLLKQIAVDLVRYQLYMRRPTGGDLPDAVKDAYKFANADLLKISRGDLSLGLKNSGKDAEESGPFLVRAPKRRFEV